MIITLNGFGFLLTAWVGAATLTTLLFLKAFGVGNEVTYSIVVGVAGSVLLVVDYRARRRMGPLSPMWRLVSSDAGGQILMIPCWIMGALAIVGCSMALFDVLRGEVPGLPQGIQSLGWLGLWLPVVLDYFFPFGFRRKQQIDSERSTPIEPS